jgi:hypothetical protein
LASSCSRGSCRPVYVSREQKSPASAFKPSKHRSRKETAALLWRSISVVRSMQAVLMKESLQERRSGLHWRKGSFKSPTPVTRKEFRQRWEWRCKERPGTSCHWSIRLTRWRQVISVCLSFPANCRSKRSRRKSSDQGEPFRGSMIVILLLRRQAAFASSGPLRWVSSPGKPQRQKMPPNSVGYRRPWKLSRVQPSALSVQVMGSIATSGFVHILGEATRQAEEHGRSAT